MRDGRAEVLGRPRGWRRSWSGDEARLEVVRRAQSSSWCRLGPFERSVRGRRLLRGGRMRKREEDRSRAQLDNVSEHFTLPPSALTSLPPSLTCSPHDAFDPRFRLASYKTSSWSVAGLNRQLEPRSSSHPTPVWREDALFRGRRHGAQQHQVCRAAALGEAEGRAGGPALYEAGHYRQRSVWSRLQGVRLCSGSSQSARKLMSRT